MSRLIEFYKSPLGKISRALVREDVVRLSGNVRGSGCSARVSTRTCGLRWRRPSGCWPSCRPGRAPRRGRARVRPHRALRSLEMPLTDAAVDLIICVHAFEHIADAED